MTNKTILSVHPKRNVRAPTNFVRNTTSNRGGNKSNNLVGRNLVRRHKF